MVTALAAPPVSPVRRLYEATSPVIGQQKARRQMAVLLAHQLRVADGDESKPMPAILAGWSGSGKTYMARMACRAVGLPFAECNATQYTESGYAGDDLAQVYLPLLESAAQMIDEEKLRESEYARSGPIVLNQPKQTATEDRGSVLKRDDIDDVIERASTGVILLDEMDKWMHRQNHQTGRTDTAIQAELLKMIEGSMVYVSDNEDELGVPFDTSKVLIIAAGAFVGLSKTVLKRLDRDEGSLYDEGFWELIEQGDFVRFGMIPELAGRLATHIFMRPLNTHLLAEILSLPDGALEQWQSRFEAVNCDWDVSPAAAHYISQQAMRLDVGARGIQTILWRVFGDALFHASTADGPTRVIFEVNSHQAKVVKV